MFETPGLCQCGCGERTTLAPQTHKRLGYVKGQPVSFRPGHNNRKPRPLCACGCGERVKGYSAKWVKGHNLWRPRPEPNPSGLCMCGCGETAPIAKKHRANRGEIAGKPVKYIRGHYGRIPDPVVDPDTGCWIWQGAKGTHGRGTKVYGKTGPGNHPKLAYRVVYEQRVGPIPEGYHLHHKCETPMCVNPDHLEPLTPEEHAQRHAVRMAA